MSKMSVRLVLGALLTTLALVVTNLVGAASAVAAPVTTVYYSASGYSGEADRAAQIWNSSVPNLRLVRGGSATIRISGTTGGGSRAEVCGLGCARIYIDSQQVEEGYSTLRIVTHEMGHGLGLPDTPNGICSYLMSGGSAGTSCRNPNPNAQEANRVNQLFAD